MNRRNHFWALLLWLPAPTLFAQSEPPKKTLKLETGEEIFQAGCVGCHGQDGKGQPQHVLGFEPPATFPDFTDCSGSTRETDTQWSAVIHQGGHARGFSEIMPSFGPSENPALTDDQIGKVIKYLRHFCPEDSKWPSGEFNVPRPMFTEKAFPEDELIFLNTINTNGAPGYLTEIVKEKRFGTVSNIEFRVRGNFNQQPGGGWKGTVGDVTLAYKRAILVNNRTKSLLSWGSEVLAPTGNSHNGGAGNWELEQFLAYTQVLPKNTYFMQQVGAEGPFKRHDDPIQAYARTAIGKTFLAERGLGRAFSITNEFVTTRNLAPRQDWTLALVPQIQVTVSKRQHMRLAIGYNIPVVKGPPNPAAGINSTSQQQLIFYWLWDTFDGGFFEGWK